MSQVEYGPLAQYYELINEACVPYDDQAAFVWAVLEEYGSGEGDVRVLDVAAGPGLLSKRMAAGGLNVVGFDLSEELFRQAHNKLPGRAIRADMRVLPFGERFDMACCLLHTINYMARDEDLRSAFGEIARALKPGGLLVMDFIAYTPRSDWNAEWTETILRGELKIETSHQQSADWRRMVATDRHSYTVTDGDRTWEASGVDELRITSPGEIRQFAEAAGLDHLATTGKYRLNTALGYDGGAIVARKPSR